jgi:exoribonuclease R
MGSGVRVRVVVMARVNMLIPAGLKTAKYFCTGGRAVEEFSHYALAVPFYTHFTSPIRSPILLNYDYQAISSYPEPDWCFRRYADVIVHRLLACAIRGEPFNVDPEDVAAIADNCNQRKAAAKHASVRTPSLLCLLLEL